MAPSLQEGGVGEMDEYVVIKKLGSGGQGATHQVCVCVCARVRAFSCLCLFACLCLHADTQKRLSLHRTGSPSACMRACSLSICVCTRTRIHTVFGSKALSIVSFLLSPPATSPLSRLSAQWGTCLRSWGTSSVRSWSNAVVVIRCNVTGPSCV